MRFVLEQTPAESTAYRFARLDLRYHPGPAGYHVKGDAARGEVYYTNSTYLNVQAPINPIERVKREGLFHPLIEAGSLSHIWLGESRPSAGVARGLRRQDLPADAERPDRVLAGVHQLQRLPAHVPRPAAAVPVLRLGRGRRDHADHRVLHARLLVEQGQARGADGPLPLLGALRHDLGKY